MGWLVENDICDEKSCQKNTFVVKKSFFGHIFVVVNNDVDNSFL